MKKITFILFALIAGTAFAQTNNSTVTVQAQIVKPVSVSHSGVLNFGKLTPTGTPGTVTLSPGLIRTFSDGAEGVSAYALPSTPAVPTFTVINNGETFNITATVTTPDLTTDSQGLTIQADSVTYNLGNGDTTGTTDSEFQIGATLNIPASITAGVYDAGRINLEVTYN